MKKTALLLAPTLLALACVGCSPSPESPADPAAKSSRMVGYIDEFNARTTILADESASESALGKVAACMKEQGFTFKPEAFGSDRPAKYLTDLKDKSLPEATFAKRWGFGIAPVSAQRDLTAMPKETSQLLLDAGAETVEGEAGMVSPEYMRAYHGEDGRSGCFAKHTKALSDHSVQHDEFGGQIHDAKLKFVKDQRVIDHYADWSECMKNKGTEATSPLAAQIEAKVTAGPVIVAKAKAKLDKIAEAEQRIASNTVSCGEKIHDLLPEQLTPVWEEYAPKKMLQS